MCMDHPVVQEIIGYQRPTPIPNTPAWVQGVVNIRGTVIPVVDVRRRFGLEAVPASRKARLLVVRIDGRVQALLVDAVLGLVSRLPDGARYALWTTGDRPTKLVDHTDDRGAAGTALRRVAPQGCWRSLFFMSPKNSLKPASRSVLVSST